MNTGDIVILFALALLVALGVRRIAKGKGGCGCGCGCSDCRGCAAGPREGQKGERP